MPPKRKKRKSTAKSVARKTVSDGGDHELRPKKNLDFKQLNDGKGPAKAKNKSNQPSVKKVDDAEELSLSPNSSDDDIDVDQLDENLSNSANPVMDDAVPGTSKDQPVIGQRSNGDDSSAPVDISKQVKEMVGKCFKKLSKSIPRRKRSKKKRRYSTSSDSSVDSYSSESESTSEGSNSSIESSEDEARKKRKRKRSDREKRKKDKKKRKKGKLIPLSPSYIQSPSQSTVYTRGCKSPVINPGQSGSSSNSSTGHIDSNADTDDFINSLHSSFN